jgi:hypothetical protein
MKNLNDPNGYRTRDLPACSPVPQPTAPPRTSVIHALTRNQLTFGAEKFLSMDEVSQEGEVFRKISSSHLLFRNSGQELGSCVGEWEKTAKARERKFLLLECNIRQYHNFFAYVLNNLTYVRESELKLFSVGNLAIHRYDIRTAGNFYFFVKILAAYVRENGYRDFLGINCTRKNCSMLCLYDEI